MTTNYTREEVFKHNTKRDCWVIRENLVYNVTDFLEEHPGGEDVILEYAGRDITKAFAEIGHSDTAIEQLKDYLVGCTDPATEKSPTKKKKSVAVQTDVSKSGTSNASGGTNWFPISFVILLILGVVVFFFGKFNSG
eukprot:TRINITY_DN2106_c0_g11_i1.p1 TRINITY_DN2106_c0_g11~~TRINITY_DN2106_c0_g11_i1.p1  ORF type:complete len:137 (+),score=32.15 TRINITY_DN2106_c0_g11_i1:125-535(+)